MQEHRPEKISQPNCTVCPLCPQHCVVAEGDRGLCQARKCRQGQMVSATYGEVAAMHVDPIEKKPLFHFYPGTSILSVGGSGCNLSCTFCQNFEISQHLVRGQEYTPFELSRMALQDNSLGICFTYSEPLVWFEMVLETAALVKDAGGKTVLVTNGTIMPRYLRQILEVIDAVNIDVKAYSDDFYRTYTGGRLSWVLKSLEMMAESGVHIEISTLIIPGLNDRSEEIRELATYLKGLGTPLAWHLNRYFPAYKADYPPTSENSLHALAAIGREYFPYVYLGNMGNDTMTLCPSCQSILIDRTGSVCRANIVQKTVNGKCSSCGLKIWGQGLA